MADLIHQLLIEDYKSTRHELLVNEVMGRVFWLAIIAFSLQISGVDVLMLFLLFLGALSFFAVMGQRMRRLREKESELSSTLAKMDTRNEDRYIAFTNRRLMYESSGMRRILSGALRHEQSLWLLLFVVTTVVSVSVLSVSGERHQTQPVIAAVEREIAMKSELLSQLKRQRKSKEEAAKEREAEELDKLFEDKVRKHCAKLPDSLPGQRRDTKERVKELARGIYSPEEPQRLDSICQLIKDYRENPYAVEHVLLQLGEEDHGAPLATRKVYALFFLTKAARDSWSEPLARDARKLFGLKEKENGNDQARLELQIGRQAEMLKRRLDELRSK